MRTGFSYRLQACPLPSVPPSRPRCMISDVSLCASVSRPQHTSSKVLLPDPAPSLSGITNTMQKRHMHGSAGHCSLGGVLASAFGQDQKLEPGYLIRPRRNSDIPRWSSIWPGLASKATPAKQAATAQSGSIPWPLHPDDWLTPAHKEPLTLSHALQQNAHMRSSSCLNRATQMRPSFHARVGVSPQASELSLLQPATAPAKSQAHAAGGVPCLKVRQHFVNRSHGPTILGNASCEVDSRGIGAGWVTDFLSVGSGADRKLSLDLSHDPVSSIHFGSSLSETISALSMSSLGSADSNLMDNF
jgi:hypothetical protein